MTKLRYKITLNSIIGYTNHVYILINMKYLIVIHKSKYGYDVHVPALPGCHSQGATQKEALENIRDAIITYLEMGREELKGSEVRELEVTFA